MAELFTGVLTTGKLFATYLLTAMFAINTALIQTLEWRGLTRGLPYYDILYSVAFSNQKKRYHIKLIMTNVFFLDNSSIITRNALILKTVSMLYMKLFIV